MDGLNQSLKLNPLGLRKNILIITGVLLMFIGAVLSPQLRQQDTIIQFLHDLSQLLILSLGLAMVFLSGSRDYSLGGIYILALAFVRIWRSSEFSLESSLAIDLGIASLICLATGLIGALIGYLVSWRPSQSTLITVSMALILGGLGGALMTEQGPWCGPWFCAEKIISAQTIFIGTLILLVISSFRLIRFFWPEPFWIKPVALLWVLSLLLTFVAYQYSGLPLVSVTAIICFVLVYLFMSRTLPGKMIQASGGNREAARLCGVSVTSVSILCFFALGLFAGMAALFETEVISKENFAYSYIHQLDAYVAILVGGISSRGGYGGIGAALSGVFFISIINLLSATFAWPIFVPFLIKGALLFLAMILEPPQREAY